MTVDLVDKSDIMIKGHSPGYNEFLDEIKKLKDTSYYDNIYCSRYLGEFIELFIIKAMGGEPIPYTTVRKEGRGGQPKPIDFFLNRDGKRLKVKNMSSCLVIDDDDMSAYWSFKIYNNHNVDAFLLTAFDTKESLEPQYMWFIMANDIFETETTSRPFWDRYSLNLKDNYKIAVMKQYELTEELQILKKLITGYQAGMKKENDIKILLLKKQRQIMSAYGRKVGMEKLIRQLILNGYSEYNNK